jgi:uncharacterized protein YrrD
MHVRFSTVIGLPVREDHAREACATLRDVLIHPDTGKIEGFFVAVPGFLRSEERFLQTMDILHWGKHVRIRDTEVLIPVEDVIRLERLLEEGRPVLGQRILTEGELFIGMCRDVQFDTKHFLLEWIFPRKMLRWGRGIPASSIVEVRPDGIVVRDSALVTEREEKAPILQGLETA